MAHVSIPIDFDESDRRIILRVGSTQCFYDAFLTFAGATPRCRVVNKHGFAFGERFALAVFVLRFEQADPVVQVVGLLLLLGERALDLRQLGTTCVHLLFAALQRGPDVADLDVQVGSTALENRPGTAQFELLVRGCPKVVEFARARAS